MKQWKVSDSDGGPAMRCGRCADILPDETLTFCKMCGVPFSEVYPTNSFVLIADHKRHQIKYNRQRKFAALSFASAFVLMLFYSLSLMGVQSIYLETAKTEMREVHFYIKDFENLPALDPQIKREAIFVSQRAFEDHFGLSLNDLSIHDNAWPEELSGVFEETQNQLDENTEHKSPAQFIVPAMRLSFWETKVFPAMNLQRTRDPQAPLNIVITNLPIFAGSDKNSSVETRHLSNSGLITGLGHPALVIISTYRLHNEDPQFKDETPSATSIAEQTRFLGEYAIAHELGHALLGLSDYVTPPEVYSPLTLSALSKNHAPKGRLGARTIASIGDANKVSDVSQCLMHTDQGGGKRAWASLKKRELGVSSNCSAYENLTRAFNLRFQSIELLKIGQREDAEKLHAQAIQLAQPLAQEWLSAEWKKEHQMFLSFFSRLTFGLFVVQSKHD